ncbi:phage tail family protein [Enterococcus saccharolyticus]|uniref:distal tail protein Dit n=1 Tax=Enterococcus saccharolyticus TaxID=41997 RepID=UPI001E421E34|nr:distal tail protein Dit [Enterococcus saccharolyticus]MCD5001178.1 phage tail family protein [Enterococcus saccharolyticus]
MNSITMSVDGFDFGKYMVINKLMRPSYATESQMSGETTSDGLDILYTRNTETKITIEATLLSDKENNYMSLDEINELIKSKLRSKKDRRIIFSDFPNRYWVGRIDGTDNLDYMSPKIGTLTIVFTIPKGISYAVNKKLFTAQLNADGILQMEVDNQGTEETPLSFSATINDDNGFLGAVTSNGAMEFGKISEVDGRYDPNENVYRDEMKASSAGDWQVNVGNINWKLSNSDIPNKQQGTFRWRGELVEVSDYGTPSTEKLWYGPSLSRDLQAPEFDGDRTRNWKHVFWLYHKSNGNAQKIGRQEINISGNGESVASFVIFDDRVGVNKTVFEFWIFGQKVKVINADKNLNEFYGSVEIWKEGKEIYFKIYHYESRQTLTYSFYSEAIATSKIDKVTWWVSRFLNYNVTNMSLNYADFTWVKSPKFVDMPNRYMLGNVLRYDGDSGKFYINRGDGETLIMDDIVHGSTDLMIPPGKNFVQFYYSEFSSVAPTIVGEIRERWL